jgi:putative DNA primase/helicase
MTHHNITPELIRAALQHIPANLSRDDWARVGMAIKSEFADDTGRDLFTTWSASAEGFDAMAAKSTWQSIKAGGGVGIGTLLHLAKESGFVMPQANQAPSKPDPATAARLASDRAATQQAEQARQQAAHADAALEAVRLWDSASDTGQSAYLTRKGVQPYGVRFGADGWLLVPVRDASGKLWNVQRIAADKPASGPDKLFLKGGRKSGLWHMCGDPAGAAVLLIAEGYATAASLHQATGRTVAVAFDAGNLAPVAKALHKSYPAALLVLCGDDDAQTFARAGHNPGRDKATAAALAVHGLAVFPEGLPEGGSDFNDLHQAAGFDAVRLIVDSAIDSHEPHQDKRQATKASTAGKRSQSGVRERTGPQNAADSGNVFDRFFVVDGDGVYYTPPGDDGGTARKVCGVLRVVGLARDAHDNQAALLLEFVTMFGKVRRWLMPLSMLAGDGNAYRVALNGQGFMCPTKSAQRQWMTEYLQSRSPESLQLVRHVPRVGWAGRCYVLPNETLGTNASGETVIFHSEAGIEANFNQRGTADQWRDDLARLCVGNSRAAFAVATAFAGPLLAWAQGVTGGGIHYTGQTSIGKTTCFLLAASVWGKGTEKDPDSYMQKWRATSNGLEYQGEQHNDCTLILDELGQMDAGDAGNAAYMLADGMGKTRGKGAGGLRPKPTWRLLFLSSGELTLAQHMETVGKKMKGGQEVRLIPIPTEVKEGSALETFHEFATGHELSGFVQHNAARCYGTVGRAWLEYLVAHTDGLGAALRERMDAIEAQIVPAGASGQVKRGGRRFALIAAAGEMATAAGLTAWPVGEAIRAAHTCFDAWLTLRGGAGSSEKANMLRQVRAFLETHGDGRFAMWHRAADDHAAKTLHRAGVRRMLNEDGEPVKTNSQHGAEFGERMPAALGEGVSFEYFVLAETFKAEVCKGFDVQAVCAVLVEHGALIVKEPGRYSIKTKLPGIGPARCYLIPPAIFDLDV